MEDTREYHEEHSEHLTNDYQRGFRYAAGHGAMIGYWSNLHTAPVSKVLLAFALTPSIAIPMLLNVPPPPIDEVSTAHIKEALSNEWEVESLHATPPLPIPPPLPHFPND